MGSWRFIPARAGNTGAPAVLAGVTTVHPRAGGEHGEPIDIVGACFGSSPRGRGTQMVCWRLSEPVRFIPARAGNTSSSQPTTQWATVHPRAGGEHFSNGPIPWRDIGSSPRGRGTHLKERAVRGANRFIPARAGNTFESPWSTPPSTVHPRAGGEHSSGAVPGIAGSGSSPRGRGTLPADRQAHLVERFIPARAGNTAGGVAGESGPPVHPRAGGEHPDSVLEYVDQNGSSPRGRGTHHLRRHHDC